MDNNEKVVDGFPEYVVTREGKVYTIRNGMERRPSLTRAGAVKITLNKNGVAHTRSLALIVARAHLYNDHNPDIFDTPIHLDNDLRNNHVDNLMWRPRWFAVKYQKQYWKPEFRHSTTHVVDTQTGVGYNSLIEPCQKFGLLYMDILNSCTTGDTVFPTWKVFAFLN
jgi:hypothetical protein